MSDLLGVEKSLGALVVDGEPVCSRHWFKPEGINPSGWAGVAESLDPECPSNCTCWGRCCGLTTDPGFVRTLKSQSSSGCFKSPDFSFSLPKKLPWISLLSQRCTQFQDCIFVQLLHLTSPVGSLVTRLTLSSLHFQPVSDGDLLYQVYMMRSIDICLPVP